MTTNYERQCYNCQREINKSDGSVLARDLIKFMQKGEVPEGGIREFCGICTLTTDPYDIE